MTSNKPSTENTFEQLEPETGSPAPESNKIEPMATPDGHHDSPTKTDGQKLREALDAARKRQIDLAETVGVSRAAVYRWVNTEEFPSRMWRTISIALEKMGIDPGQIRPATAQNPDQLLGQLIEWMKRMEVDQLRILRTVLRADEMTRGKILMLLEGALMREK
jgi:transcriptional regulator with XRE-family HTH domain